MVSEFYPPHVGGVETFVQNLAENLVEHGHECTVLCTSDVEGDETINGVRVMRLPNSPLEFHGVNFFFKGTLKRIIGEFDIVHINSFYPFLSLEASRECVRQGVPYVFSPHYHGKGHSPLGKLLFYLYKPMASPLFRDAAMVICCSDYEKGLVLESYPFCDRVTTISHGVQKFDLDNRGRDGNILFIGRMERYKGPQHVVGIVKRLHEKGKEVKAVMVGDGPMKESIEKEIELSSLSGFVKIIPHVERKQLDDLIKRSSLLVLLSEAEAYGLVVAEALSQGTPCLVSDRMALREFEGEQGCIVYKGKDYDYDELAEIVWEVLSDPPAVGPLTDKIPSIKRMTGMYISVYEKVLEGNRSQ